MACIQALLKVSSAVLSRVVETLHNARIPNSAVTVRKEFSLALTLHQFSYSVQGSSRLDEADSQPPYFERAQSHKRSYSKHDAFLVLCGDW